MVGQPAIALRVKLFAIHPSYSAVIQRVDMTKIPIYLKSIVNGLPKVLQMIKSICGTVGR